MKMAPCWDCQASIRAWHSLKQFKSAALLSVLKLDRFGYSKCLLVRLAPFKTGSLRAALCCRHTATSTDSKLHLPEELPQPFRSKLFQALVVLIMARTPRSLKGVWVLQILYKLLTLCCLLPWEPSEQSRAEEHLQRAVTTGKKVETLFCTLPLLFKWSIKPKSVSGRNNTYWIWKMVTFTCTADKQHLVCSQMHVLTLLLLPVPKRAVPPSCMSHRCYWYLCLLDKRASNTSSPQGAGSN